MPSAPSARNAVERARPGTVGQKVRTAGKVGRGGPRGIEIEARFCCLRVEHPGHRRSPGGSARGRNARLRRPHRLRISCGLRHSYPIAHDLPILTRYSADIHWICLGSMASRRPSPMKLMLNTVIRIIIRRRHPDPGAGLKHVQAACRFEHVAPAWRGQGYADAEKAQTSFQQNGRVDGEGDRGQQRRNHQRHNMGHDEAQIAGADQRCGEHKLLLAQRQHLPAHQTGDVQAS